MHIAFHGVSKRFGDVNALADVTCEIPPGQIVAVLGANGAGKSTLLKLLAALLAPTAGSVTLDGELLTRQRIDLRRRIAWLPDSPKFLGTTPLLHMARLLHVYEAETRGCEEVAAAFLGELDLLPLAECSLRTLSRGQQYKAALAAHLVLDPEVWLLDEPFAAGMDPQGHAVLKRHANKAAGRGATILYTTQILEIAEAFSDRLLIFERGRLHAFDSAAHVPQGLERLLAELRSGADVPSPPLLASQSK